MQWRQGDVLIETAAEVPKSALRRANRVLYEGEATGHRHRIDDVADVELFEVENTLYLRVKSPEATVVHDEHGPITLSEGLYRVWQQREYRPGRNVSVKD